MNKFNINVVCVVIAVDMSQNRQFVLSLDKDNIIFPTFNCSDSFLSNNNHYLIDFLKKYVFISDIELLPQLINISYQKISKDSNTIDIIYGFVIGKTNSIHESYWFEFDYHQPNEYSHILFEVTQKLK